MHYAPYRWGQLDASFAIIIIIKFIQDMFNTNVHRSASITIIIDQLTVSWSITIYPQNIVSAVFPIG